MDIPTGVWQHYGYSGSPYSTTALRIDNADERLLVGRDDELTTVLRDLASGGQVVALEGDYGVGKSSLAAVAAYQASRWKRRRTSVPLFLATRRPLELSESETDAEFERRVYYQVAAAILLVAEDLIRDGYKLRLVDDFRRWLETPEAASWSAGIGITTPLGGGSVSAGRGKSVNSGKGFNDSGVTTLVDSWLTEIFPNAENGGVILLLDNLEVLGKFPAAPQMFESLRDRLFKRPGLRWIISGAEGMVRTALNTPKMSGVFPEPIELRPLDPSDAPEVIRRRASVMQTRADAKLPVSPEAFESAYLATGKNLRVALGLAERFSMRTDPASMVWKSQDERDEEFLAYRNSEGLKVVESLVKKVSKTGWRVLEKLVRDLDGVCSPGDYDKFNYANMSSLIAQIQPLAALGLIDYTVDENDARRRVVTATERGRLAVASRIPHA
mgnify:CR=1 FL=1